MAETTLRNAAGHQIEQWRCTACGEPWDLVRRAGAVNRQCPECHGPLRLVSSPPSYHDIPVERALVAVSPDQQWLVVHWADYRAPWTILRRLEEGDGYSATGVTYPDTGQSAGDILTAFLATQRERESRLLHHLAAD